MTVTSTTNVVTRNGNGVATSFSFPYTIYAATELSVVKVASDGTETQLSSGTGANNYAVVVSSYPGSGSITYPASGTTLLASGESLVIRRRLALTQEIDLENQGGYNPETQEKAYDRGVMVAQQQQNEIDRSLKAPVSDPVTSWTLPKKADRASKTLIFDADGNPGAGSATSTAISAAMEAVVTAATLAAARTAMGTPSANDSGILNATLHSTPMNGDGSTDNKAAFDSCVAYCIANDLRLYIPFGRYIFSSAPADITSPITIFGDGYISTNLIRSYTPGTATDGFLVFDTAYWSLQHLDVSAADSTSTGYAIVSSPGAGGGASWCVLRDVRILADQGGSITGSWTRGLHFDGNANASGVRDMHCHNVNVFDCTDTTATVYLRKAIACDFVGGGVYPGTNGATPQKVLVTGSSGNTSQRVRFEGLRIVGTLNLAWAQNCGGSLETDYGVTIDSNSSNCALVVSGSTTVTNSSTSSLVIANNILFTSSAAGIDLRGVGLQATRADGFAPIFSGYRSDAHGDSAAVTNFVGFGQSDAAATVQFATLVAYALQDADGAEYGQWLLQTIQNGTNTTEMIAGGGLSTDPGTNPKGAGSIYAAGPVMVPTYTVAGVPSASTYARGIIYVSDETGGAVLAFSDGTNWRRVTDRAVVS